MSATELILTREQVRDLDRQAIDEYGMPGVVLMENAGRGTAEWLCQLVEQPTTVAICCGKGNNAGDGFVIARHLHNHGWNPTLNLFTDPESLSGDAAINYRVAEKAGYRVLRFDRDAGAIDDTIAHADWVIDALLGTGVTGSPRPPMDQAIEMINQREGHHVLAIDLPSGLDADAGTVSGSVVIASHTATFVARKPGFTKPEAVRYLGVVRVIDIGVPQSLIQTFTTSPN